MGDSTEDGKKHNRQVISTANRAQREEEWCLPPTRIAAVERVSWQASVSVRFRIPTVKPCEAVHSTDDHGARISVSRRARMLLSLRAGSQNGGYTTRATANSRDIAELMKKDIEEEERRRGRTMTDVSCQ